ncbi:hypothetical protein HJC23_013134 [Cyclotella cryptica]|uniref:beta-galactosidase n=1 Tax=Cyclotella cryptica TaxID=29204 RepID=A0ABD3QNQ6_9STRA|eukprot:CCRYP_003944-RA/>CCRYP_003944-RA protein AED:0.03 eAED:0.03 QI:0/0/0/1/1/1/2/0/1288
MNLLDLNDCYGSHAAPLVLDDNPNIHHARSSTPNIWENPSVTGIHRLPPHSRSVASMAEDYCRYKQQCREGMSIRPCVCLDSSALESRVSNDDHDVTSSTGWRFRLFCNPCSIPLDYILPKAREKELVFCENKVSIPHNWTMMPCHRRPVSDVVSNANTNSDSSSDIPKCGCQISDPPRYTNVRMPFSTLYPHVPIDNPSGVYRLEFSLNACQWTNNSSNDCSSGTTFDQRVILHFGAVESCFFVYLNARFVGMGKDSRLPSEFDVTAFLKCNCCRCTDEAVGSSNMDNGKGKNGDNDLSTTNNILTVIVLKWSDGSFLEQQDHWRGMGGIHRSVFLYSIPREAYIEDVFCRATIAKANEEISQGKTYPLKWKGLIRVDARIGRGPNTRVEGRDIYYNENIKCLRSARSDNTEVEYRMLFQLYDRNDVAIFDKPLDVTDPEATCLTEVNLRSNLISFAANVPGNIMAWSDEAPNLYRLEATLVRVVKQDEIESFHSIDTFHTKIGFRSIEITNRQLLINGEPVLIKGVNRHDHSPTRGKAVSRDEIRSDLILMKEHNFNAIRTAHYPNDPYLCDLADELGMYVVDEANIECHGHYDMVCRENTFAAAMLDRVQRMVVRDQNHPCIIGFSLGNEAGFAMNHTMLYGWIKGYDDSRFVQYEGANRPKWGQLPHVYDRKDSVLGTDVICPMYATIDEMIEWADVTAPQLNEQRPLILCEYAHAMGNSSGSLYDYWQVIKSRHGLQGGFIWDWIDQGVLERDDNGKFWFAYGGDYGDIPHDANFNINGMIGPDRQPHPAMIEFKKIAQPVDFELERRGGEAIIRVSNRRYFTTLDDLKATWTLKADGFLCDKGTFNLFGVPPQTNSEQRIDLSKVITLPNDVEVHLDIKAISIDDDSEVAFDQLMVQKGGSTSSIRSRIYHACKHIARKTDGNPNIELNRTNEGLSFSANDYELQVSHTAVELTYSSKIDGTIMDGLRVNLFRAGTDNDGVKQFGVQLRDPSKPLGKWLSMGLDFLGFEAIEVSSRHVNVPVLDNDLVEYPTAVTKARIVGLPGRKIYTGIAIAENVTQSQPVFLGDLEQSVTMLRDGSLFIDVKVKLKESIADLPRVGVELSIPVRLDETCFFANGPHENYPDRQFSAHAGVYEETVPETLDCYVVPQEQGSRTGLRWLFVSEKQSHRGPEALKKATVTPSDSLEKVLENKTGFLIVPCDKDLLFHVSRYSDAEIFAARHVNELTPSSTKSLYVRLDAAQRGLGTGSCGPQTLPKYHVNGGSYRIAFWLKPVGSSQRRGTQ